MNPVSIRLLNQQLAAPQFHHPAEVVSHMGAIQAQDYRMMRWAVAMRTTRPSHKAFKKAYDEGKIIRLHLMRGTWQLVSAEDYWSFLELCAPKAIAVTKGWMSNNKITISDDEQIKVRDIFVKTAADKGSATKEDFVQSLAENGVSLDDHRLSYHLRMAEMSGTLCSGDLHPTKATYALASEKVRKSSSTDRSACGSKNAGCMREHALMRFTRKYFQSHQPATLEDFVWWSGLNVSDCKRGIELLGESIHKVSWRGRDFYLTDECRTRGFRKGHVLLIPPYDEYLIGYKGGIQKLSSVSGRGTTRDIVLPTEHRHRAHNNSGIFRPIIAHNGIICGNWSPFKEECQAEFFDGADVSDAVQDAWYKYMRYKER